MDEVVCAKIHHVNNFIQLSSLRWTTISNTVICTLHNFVSSRKLDLFIRALLQDHIIAWKKLRLRLTYILLNYWNSLKSVQKITYWMLISLFVVLILFSTLTEWNVICPVNMACHHSPALWILSLLCHQNTRRSTFLFIIYKVILYSMSLGDYICNYYLLLYCYIM